MQLNMIQFIVNIKKFIENLTWKWHVAWFPALSVATTVTFSKPPMGMVARSGMK
jgi:hypothetical protein